MMQREQSRIVSTGIITRFQEGDGDRFFFNSMPSESAPLLSTVADWPDEVDDFPGGLLADEPGEREAFCSCQTILHGSSVSSVEGYNGGE